MSDRDNTTLMLLVHSARLVSTSQLCILPESLLSDSSCPDHRNTPSKLHFLFQSISQRGQIINIYCTSTPASVPLPQHLLQPRASVSSVADVFSISIPSSRSYSVFLYFSPTLSASPGSFNSALAQTATPLFGTFLPLLLSSSLPSSPLKSPAPTIKI